MICLLVGAVACYQSVTLLAQTRAARLLAAERHLAQAAVPLIRQNRVPPTLIQVTETLLGNRRLGLNYITLRNAANATLVSRGRFAEGFGWLSSASAVQWRSLVYRILSAEDRQALTRNGQVIGFAGYGVSWWSILSAAGAIWLFWTALLLAAGAAFCRLVVRPARGPGAPAANRTVSPSHPGQPSPPPLRSSGKASSRVKAKRSDGKAEAFTPIKPVSPDPEPIATPEPRAQPSRPEAVPEPFVATAVPSLAPEPSAVAPEAAPESGPPVAADFHAPQLDAEPTLGDDTLDLRLYPVWRGSDRRVLAGARAALAWRSGEAELVDVATLTRLAERDNAMRAFTHWAARRFSILHSNWCNLELHAVPIVLSVPAAMLAFAGAEKVWRDAVAHTDRDPDDLVLQRTRQSAEDNPAQLPIRQALAGGEPVDMHADCDVLCVKPEQVSEAREQWRARLDEPGPPILFGPVSQPDGWREMLDHHRVVWFTEESSELYSAREFARLLARRECRAF